MTDAQKIASLEARIVLLETLVATLMRERAQQPYQPSPLPIDPIPYPGATVYGVGGTGGSR